MQVATEVANYRFDLALPKYRRKIRTFSAIHTRDVPWSDYDDIQSEILEVLYLACCGYDPNCGASFNTYFWQAAINRLKDLKKSAFRQKRLANLNAASLDDESVREVVEELTMHGSPEEHLLARISVAERFDSGKRQK